MSYRFCLRPLSRRRPRARQARLMPDRPMMISRAGLFELVARARRLPMAPRPPSFEGRLMAAAPSRDVLDFTIFDATLIIYRYRAAMPARRRSFTLAKSQEAPSMRCSSSADSRRLSAGHATVELN